MIRMVERLGCRVDLSDWCGGLHGSSRSPDFSTPIEHLVFLRRYQRLASSKGTTTLAFARAIGVPLEP